MTDILAEICSQKSIHVSERKRKVPLHCLEQKIKNAAPPKGFIKAIEKAHKNKKPAIIAEIKKASPSAGIIATDFNPQKTALEYAAHGATCLSVLTDTPYFQGQDDDLKAVRHASPLPLLRKDFMIDPYQIYEARALGADCILLIMAALSFEDAHALESIAVHLGMDVLVEVHDQEELEQALRLRTKLIGINNRNLKTMKTDIHTSIILGRYIPDDKIIVCESGIRTRAEIDLMLSHGIETFLVGESLMKQESPGMALKSLLNA